MSYRLFLLLALIVCLPLGVKAANAPGFRLTFRFQPPLVVSGTKPKIRLEACRDSNCETLGASLPLSCVIDADPQHNAEYVIHPVFTECYADAVILNNGQETVDKPILSQPGNLRLVATDGVASLPFYFAGGNSTPQQTQYHFIVRPGNEGLSITPQ